MNSRYMIKFVSEKGNMEGWGSDGFFCAGGIEAFGGGKGFLGKYIHLE